MQWDEVDRSLDTRVLFSYDGEALVSEFTKKSNLSLQSAIHFSDNDLDVSYFIPEELEDNRDVSLFLAQTKATKEGNVFFLTYKSKINNLYDSLTAQFVGDMSLILDNAVLTNGKYILSCRLHSSDLTTLSENILKYAGMMKGLGITYLGSNPGMPSILDEIKKTVGMRSFEWEVSVPEKFLKESFYRFLPDEWVGEARYMTTGRNASHLIKTSKPVPELENSCMKPVSAVKNLYDLTCENMDPLLDYYFKSVYEARLFRFWRTIHFKDGVLRLRAILPTILTSRYMNVLSNCNVKFSDWGLTLTAVREI